MRWGHFTPLEIVAINAAIWASIQVGIGTALALVPAEHFDPRGGMLRIRSWETAAGYENYLFVQKWKRYLPDGARLNPKAFPKRRLRSKSPEYLRAFERETVRAEATHWLAIPPFLLFFIWNVPSVAIWMPVYALLVNLPCIAVQRYNRIRISRVIRLLDAREDSRSDSYGEDSDRRATARYGIPGA